MNVVQLAVSAELALSLAKPVGPPPSALADGLHQNYPDELYHLRELGMASKGALDQIAVSPLHYRAWIDGALDKEETEPLRLGKAAHRSILEPAVFDAEYLIAPEFGPLRKTDTCSSEQAKVNKTRRSEWMMAHKGATILDAASGQATLGMVRSIREHPLARPLLEEGLEELTLRWTDTETGLPCKGRTDFYRRSLATAVDIKTCRKASRAAFERAVYEFGYHRQAAHYGGGFEALGEPIEHFVFIAVEKTPPYAVAIYQLEARAVKLGQKTIRRDLGRMAECTASRVFDGYPETIQTLSLPAWAYTNESA